MGGLNGGPADGPDAERLEGCGDGDEHHLVGEGIPRGEFLQRPDNGEPQTIDGDGALRPPGAGEQPRGDGVAEHADSPRRVHICGSDPPARVQPPAAAGQELRRDAPHLRRDLPPSGCDPPGGDRFGDHRLHAGNPSDPIDIGQSQGSAGPRRGPWRDDHAQVAVRLARVGDHQAPEPAAHGQHRNEPRRAHGDAEAGEGRARQVAAELVLQTLRHGGPGDPATPPQERRAHSASSSRALASAATRSPAWRPDRTTTRLSVPRETRSSTGRKRSRGQSGAASAPAGSSAAHNQARAATGPRPSRRRRRVLP